MIEFKSLVKIENEYIDISYGISNSDVKNIDWDYVEGKIIILFYGKEVFGSEVVDDINWFWGFIADGFDSFFETGIYDVGFPSQAIQFTLLKNKTNTVNLKISSNLKVYLDKNFNSIEFLESFFYGAKAYFSFEKKFNENEVVEMERKINLIDSFSKKMQNYF